MVKDPMRTKGPYAYFNCIVVVAGAAFYRCAKSDFAHPGEPGCAWMRSVHSADRLAPWSLSVSMSDYHWKANNE
jgi:hypothetical protein